MGTKERWYGATGGYNEYNTNMSGSIVDNTSIATLDSITSGSLNVNGVDFGETYWWWSYWYGYEYDDGFDCRYAQEESIGSQPAEAVGVRYTRVTSDYGNAQFITDFSGAFASATLSLSNGSAPCNGTPFDMNANFTKSFNATLFGRNDPRHHVETPSDGQYRVNFWALKDENPSALFFSSKIQRIAPSNENKRISFTVAGFTSSENFTATARVTIICQ